MEVLPGVHQLKIPIPINPLGFVNAYLLKTRDGCILIDPGWNAADSFEAIERGLAEAGVGFGDLRYVVVTHIHPDHYGLVGHLAQLTDAKLVVHEIERTLLESRYVDYDDLLEEMDEWLRINGVPPSERATLQKASLGMLGLVAVEMPDQTVHGGERLVVGDFNLEIIWTPGHSAGHICLYDSARKALFSGDHLLEKITPNVSMTTQSRGNPLVDYLNSLSQIAELQVDLVLPGHGEPFRRFSERIEEMKQHHERRLNELLSICSDKPKTAYEIAKAATWFNQWDDMRSFTKRAAVTETLSHLELLVARCALTKTTRDGIVWYQV